MIKSKNLKILLIGVMILLLIPLVFHKDNVFIINQSLRTSAEQAVEYYDKEWISNNGFYGLSPWTYVEEGEDPSDLSYSNSGYYGNINIDGETKTFSGVSGIVTSSEWNKTINTEYPGYPSNHDFVVGEGFLVDHSWTEGANQEPSVQLERNISIEEDMSEYIITSVSIDVIVNATVHANDGNNGGIEGSGDAGVADGYTTGDYIQFYAKITDLPKNKPYLLAWNQTAENLGDDIYGENNSMVDTSLTPIAESKLIDYLTSVLSTDNHNFTIIIGMRIHCEDNYVTNGKDFFDAIYIKTCDFSFTYEKKINKLTTASFNQEGPTFSSVKYEETNNITLLDATLNFNYRISETWPTSASPNAEIRVFINENQNPVTINLDRATTDWDTETYNVKSLISLGVDDVNLTIQLFLGDELGLGNVITVSIDDVYLHIWYQEIGVIAPQAPPPDYTPAITALSVAIVGMTIGLLSYIFYFQFPPLVRIIKKLKRMVKKEKKLKKPIEVQGRDNFIRSKIQEKMQSLRIQPQFENALKTVPSSSPPKMGINK